MLQRLVIAGYKCFRNETTLDLAPVTVLAGANSAGKSSVFQVLRLLRQSFGTSSGGPGLILNGDEIQVGRAEDVVTSDATGRAESVAISVEVGSGTGYRDDVPYTRGLLNGFVLRTTFAAPEHSLTLPLSELTISVATRGRVPERFVVKRRAASPSPEAPGVPGMTQAPYVVVGSGGTDLVALQGLSVQDAWSPDKHLMAIVGTRRRILEECGAILRVVAPPAAAADAGSLVDREALARHLARLDDGEILEWAATFWRQLLDPDLAPTDLRTRLVAAVTQRFATIESVTADLQRADLFRENATHAWLAPAIAALASLEGGARLRQLIAEAIAQRASDAPTYIQSHGSVPLWGVQEFFAKRVVHLGPVREAPKQLYSFAVPAEGVGARGEAVVNFLAAHGSSSDARPMPPQPGSAWQSEDVPLITAISAWASWIGVARDIEVVDAGKYGRGVRVTGFGGSVSDLPHVGTGLSQVLPILALCLAVPRDSTILLEQPELHLHPSAQTRMATFFNACAASGRQIVIETHSDHIINGLRLDVARGWVDPSNGLAMLSFAPTETSGTSVVRVEIDRDGVLTDWPPGFFDEADTVLAEMLRLRTRRRR
ncbi:AAA family ATPase [Sandaracinus amylolyticus]|nr:DUF3696 domain-containing protein [Sandaracinus amylolyticus]